MAFIHGWKSFRVVPAHETVALQDDEMGHVHNTLSPEFDFGWDLSGGFKFYTTFERAWEDTGAVYAHVTCLGPVMLHEYGGRTLQYSLDYFLSAPHVPELQTIADNLNVSILDPQEGCPVCRGEATEKEKEDWFGETYRRPTWETRDSLPGSTEDSPCCHQT